MMLHSLLKISLSSPSLSFSFSLWEHNHLKIIKIQIFKKKKSTWPTCCVFLVDHGVIFTRQLTASHCFTQHSNFFFFGFLFLCSNCHQVLNIKNHQQQSCRPYYLVNKISMVPSSVSLSLLIKRMYRIFNFFFLYTEW